MLAEPIKPIPADERRAPETLKSSKFAGLFVLNSVYDAAEAEFPPIPPLIPPEVNIAK